MHVQASLSVCLMHDEWKLILCYNLVVKICFMERRRCNTMPEISLFYGIRITMYYEDHNSPHFHAEYNGHKALIDINEA